MRQNRYNVAILLICLLAFAMRVWKLYYPQFGGDEGFTYMLASLSYGDLARKIIEIGEPQPVGSYFLEKLWLDMGGNSEFALRMLNIWFGVLAVALMGRLMVWFTRREIGQGQAGQGQALPLQIGAALILAVNQFGLAHSREYRTYAMAMALCLAYVLAALAYARCRTSQPRWPQMLLLIGCGWAAIQAHYVVGFVLAAFNIAVLLWHVMARRSAPDDPLPKPPPLIPWLASQALTLALTLPWLILVRGTTNTYPGTGRGQLGFGTVYFEELALFSFGSLTSAVENIPWPQIGVIVLSIAMLFSLMAAWRATNRAKLFAMLMAVTFAVPLVTVWALTWIKPIFHPRYLIVIWPMAIALACAWPMPRAISSLQRVGTTIRTVLCAGLVAIATVGGALYLRNLDPIYYWLNLINTVAPSMANLPPHYTRLTINMPDPGFLYYYRKAGPAFDNSLTFPKERVSREGDVALFDAFTQQRVRRIVVHVAPNTWWDINNHAATLDPRGYVKVNTFKREGDYFDVYERTFGDRLTPINATFKNGISLVGAEVFTDELNTAIGFELQFTATQSTQSPQPETKTFIHLIDPNNPTQIVAQLDLPLPSDLSKPHLYGLTLPKDLPPRPYELWFGLYEPSRPGAPRVQTQDGQDRVRLGHYP